MKFFLDNNLSPYLAAALHALSEPHGHIVTHLQDKFSRDVSDVDWITGLGAEGNWIIVSGDYRITRNAHERAAWQASGLTSFFLERGWMKIPLWDFAWKLVRWWPDIIAQAERIAPGASFSVPVSSSKLRLLA